MADGDVSLRFRLLGSDDGASRAFDKVGKSSEHLHGRMIAVGTAIGGLAAGAIGALGGMAVGAVKSGLETASGLQQAQIGFTTMIGSADKAKRFVGDLAQFAAATPFEMPGLVDAARTLMGVGVSAKQVIPTLTAYGDAAGALGIQQDAFQRIMVAVSQSISAGKIKLGDMNQLANNGLPVWKLLAEALHKPVPEIQNMISHGKLLSADVLPKLQAQMEKDYGGAMAKQSQTLGGLWSTLMDTFHLGMANALMPLVPVLQAILPGAMAALGTAFKGIATGVQTGIGWFKQIGPALSQAFGDPKTHAQVNELKDAVVGAYRTIWNAISPVLRQIWTTIQTQLVPAFAAFARAMEPVVVFMYQRLGPIVATVWKTVLTVIDGALKVISGLLNVFAGLFTGNWSRLWQGVKQILSGLWEAILGILKGALSALGRAILAAGSALVAAAKRLVTMFWQAWTALPQLMVQVGKDAIMGIVHGVQAMAGAAVDAAKGVASGIVNGVKGFLGISSPAKKLIPVGRDVINGVIEGLKQVAPQAYAFMEAFAKTIAGTKVTAATKTAAGEAASAWGAYLQNVTKKLDVLKGKIKDQQQAFDDLMKAKADYTNSLAQGIEGGGSIAGIGLSKDEVDNQGNVTKKADQVGDFVKSLQAKNDAIQKFGNDVNQLRAEGLADAVVQQIQQAGLDTGGALASALATATPEAIKQINVLSGQIQSQTGMLSKSWAGDMYDSGIDAAKGLLDGLKSQQSKLLQAVRDITQAMVNEINKTLTLGSLASSVADSAIHAAHVAHTEHAAHVATTARGGDTHVHVHMQSGFIGSTDQLATAISDVRQRAKARGLSIAF